MFSPAYMREYRRNFQIAYPVMIGQAGHIFTQIADTVMVGSCGTEQLAAVSLAGGLVVIFMVWIMGLSTGLTALVGKANGRRDEGAIRALNRNGIWTLLLFSIILVTVAIPASPLMHYLGQSEEVIPLAMPYYVVLSFSLIPLMGFMAVKHSLDGLERTRAGMVVSLVGNLFNILLNYALIFGQFGAPEMGFMGAAWATLVARTGMFLSLFLYAYFSRRFAHYFSEMFRLDFSFTLIKTILKVGSPMAVQYFLEAAAFILGGIMVGWLGAAALASHHIALTVATVTYMVATGLGSTATIRVANLYGEGNFGRLRRVSISLFVMMIVLEGIATLGIIGFKDQISSWFISDPEVLLLSAQMLLISALFQLFDGLQVLAAGGLRGFADVRIPTAIALFAYWGISLPMGYWLIHISSIGALGVWYGLLSGLFIAFVLLSLRYRYIFFKKRRLKLHMRGKFQTVA